MNTFLVKHHSISQDNMKMMGHSFSEYNIAAYQGIYYSRGGTSKTIYCLLVEGYTSSYCQPENLTMTETCYCAMFFHLSKTKNTKWNNVRYDMQHVFVMTFKVNNWCSHYWNYALFVTDWYVTTVNTVESFIFHGVKILWCFLYVRFHRDLISWFQVNGSDIKCRLNFRGVFNFMDIIFPRHKRN